MSNSASRIHLATLLLFLIVVSACGGGSQPRSNAAGYAETPDETVQAGSVPDRVQLLDPGEEPRRELRLNVAADTHERMTIEILLVAAAALGNMVSPELVAPPIQLTVEAGPTQDAGDGHIRYRMRVSGASVSAPSDVDPDVLDEIAAEVAALQQISGFLEVDDRGVTHDIHFNNPEGVSSRTRTLLGNVRRSLMTIAYPEEPVGVGARWAVSRPVDLGTITVSQTITYTLLGMDGDRGHLEVVVRQSTAPQEMRSQDDGVQGYLYAYETTGVGYLQFDLNRLSTLSEVDVITLMRSLVSIEGTSAMMELRTRTTVRVAPVDW